MLIPKTHSLFPSLRWLALAAATDKDVRTQIQGIHVSHSKETATATDGHRLHQFRGMLLELPEGLNRVVKNNTKEIVLEHMPDAPAYPNVDGVIPIPNFPAGASKFYTTSKPIGAGFDENYIRLVLEVTHRAVEDQYMPNFGFNISYYKDICQCPKTLILQTVYTKTESGSAVRFDSEEGDYLALLMPIRI